MDHLTETELAKQLNISARTLQAQRLKGDGIPFVKIGRAVRYSAADVAAYLTAHKCSSTAMFATLRVGKGGR